MSAQAAALVRDEVERYPGREARGAARVCFVAQGGGQRRCVAFVSPDAARSTIEFRAHPSHELRVPPVRASIVVRDAACALSALVPDGEGRVALAYNAMGYVTLAVFSLDDARVETHALGESDGAPALARVGDAWVVALARRAGAGLVVLAVTNGGVLREVARFDGGARAPSLDASGATLDALALAYVDREGSVCVCAPVTAPPRVCEKTSARARAHEPAVAYDHVAGTWLVVWIAEDTGRLALCAARDGAHTRRVAEVWASIEQIDASAPALLRREGARGGALVAWREERGPRPGVYLRALDRDGLRDGDEVRVSDRAARALAGRVGLARMPEGWACAYVEAREGTTEGEDARGSCAVCVACMTQPQGAH